MSGFTHFDASGHAVMVDVSEKQETQREATAKGTQAVPAPGAHLQGKRRHHLYAGRVQFCGEPSTLV